MPPAVYFLSDAHLGGESPAREGPKERSLVAFLDERAPGEILYILGDLFDFWFDDGRPPPARYAPVVRALGRCTARGAHCLFMGGNHDWWTRVGRGPGWLERELGVEILPDPFRAGHEGLELLLTHGDALGGAHGAYRIVRGVLHNPLAIRAFALLPRAVQYGVAGRTSSSSRRRHGPEVLERDATRLRAAAGRLLAAGGIDAVVAGHVHRPELTELPGGTYLNIGDWMAYRTYGVLRDGALGLERFDPVGG